MKIHLNYPLYKLDNLSNNYFLTQKNILKTETIKLPKNEEVDIPNAQSLGVYFISLAFGGASENSYFGMFNIAAIGEQENNWKKCHTFGYLSKTNLYDIEYNPQLKKLRNIAQFASSGDYSIVRIG